MLKIYFPDIGKKLPQRLLTPNDRAGIVPKVHDQLNRSAPLLWDTLFINGVHSLPTAITNFFSSDKTFTGVTFEEATPEKHTAFDNYGKGRMCDLLIKANSDSGTIIISTEAKVDEAFDSRFVSTYKQEAEKILEKTPNSKMGARIRDLLPFVFTTPNSPEVDALRYQLVQALASAVIEADLANGIAIFCILNFTPNAPTPLYKQKRSLNDAEFDQFLKVVTKGKLLRLPLNTLEGPFNIPGKPLVPYYFLKLEQIF